MLSSSTRGSLIYCTIGVHINVPLLVINAMILRQKAQGGGTSLKSVLRAATTGQNFALSLKFCLTLTMRYSGLTVDYGEYFKLTVDFYFDRSRSSEYSCCGVLLPCRE